MTSPSLTLRDYQAEAIAALETDWAAGEQRLGIALSTGVGKTVIFSHLAHRYQSRRVLITVHRDELVEQAVDKLKRVDRTMSIGVVKAARNQGGAAVVVASIATISKPNRLAQIGRFGLIIVDEAHRSMSKSYQDTLRALGAFTDPAVRIAGFTATWSRSDNKGLGDFWQKISYSKSITWAIQNGHLVRPIGKRVVTDLDLREVKRTGGDYNERELGIAVSQDSIMKAIVLAYTQHAADRSGVLFAPTVESAEFFANGLRAAGYDAEGIFGKTNKTNSAAVHRRFRDGQTQILCTCTRLAEGWDAPWCSAAVLARPTLSRGLFIQQVGRVLRPHPGKADAVILDIVGVTDDHSLTAAGGLSRSTPTVPRREPDEDDDLDADWSIEDVVMEDDATQLPRTRDARVEGFDDVDLFAGSPARWLKTYTGVPFIRTRAWVYFLWPLPDGIAIGRCPHNTLQGGTWLDGRYDWATATMWCAQLAMDEDPRTASPWTVWHKRQPASRSQIEYAHRLGLILPAFPSRAAVTDLLDTYIVSQILTSLG